jgi:hypothetical protein
LEPYEIIVSPYEVYVAPVGTVFPEPEASIGATWKLLGKNGTRSQTEDGVTVSHEQTLQAFRTNGSTGAVKVTRPEEAQTVTMALEDLTIETYAQILGNAFSQQEAAAGVAGVRSVNLHRGMTVKTMSLLIRGPSPYLDGQNAQYQIPRCYESSNQKPKFNKKDPATLELVFDTLEDMTAATDEERFGKLRAVFTPAL